MEKMVIKGGVKLKGEAEISGAKNATLPILASTILCSGPCTIKKVPNLMDVSTIKELLIFLGISIEGSSTLVIDPSGLSRYVAPYDLVKTMRASVLVLGPLMARFKRANISMPGGCAIGARPIDLHLKGLEMLGAEICIRHGYIEVKAKKLKGNKIYFDTVTVTGTENLMMAASMAEGVTVLENAAREPEVEDLAKALNKMGVNIQGAGTNVITIEGVKELKGIEHEIIPDRIEAGTYMVAASITGGSLYIKNCIPEHIEAIIWKLREVGTNVETVGAYDGTSILKVWAEDKIKGVDVKTCPHPGFPTDMQAQLMALMTIAKGRSVITETVFENRFMHVAELNRMGADIMIEKNSAIVKGVERLSGAPVMATDLRASASLILAGLAAEGITELSRVYHLDRGYEAIEKKLSQLGADIKRVKE